MQFESYRQAVASLPLGKRLPDAVYLHESCLDEIPEVFANFIAGIAATHASTFSWNVVKLYRRDFKISLLSYPTFLEESYPTLAASLTVDLVRAKTRSSNFSTSKNPPILHRKETLVSEDHPSYPLFEEITQEGEQAGLYENSRAIGYRASWERLIASKGYALVEGRLLPKAVKLNEAGTEETEIEIYRHLTAVDRDKLSTPMQLLARHDYLDGDYSILDYGCGKGHDLLELEAHGLDASGWDPVYRPDGNKEPADLVNLGFVINVIEDRDERQEALRSAFQLAKRILVVSVMIGGEATVSKFKPYRDGVITARKTFQKYYTQAELRNFLESTLGEKAIAAAPGVFFVFRDELEEQRFLSNRQRVNREWRQLVFREKTEPHVDYQALIEANGELFQDFWTICLDLGRPPANDEFERSDELRRAIGSHKKGFDVSLEYFGQEDFELAKRGRIKDLTVFLALSFFDRQRAYARMPTSLQRDIKAFFGKPSEAYDFARQALFSIADSNLLTEACVKAHEHLQCGQLNAAHSFVFDSSLLDQLSVILRIYVGCAAQLYGDIEDVDLIKIHMSSGKVSFMTYDDFSKALPLLRERTKVRLKDQDIDFFSYSAEYDAQPLFNKSAYLSAQDPTRNAQLRFDLELATLDGLDLSGYGPSWPELQRRLKSRGLAIQGLQLNRQV